jgi:hypothetical protein
LAVSAVRLGHRRPEIAARDLLPHRLLMIDRPKPHSRATFPKPSCAQQGIWQAFRMAKASGRSVCNDKFDSRRSS